MTGREENNEDTIAAISTPLGEGGVGVVRISGPGSLAILRKLIPSHKPLGLESHRLYLETIKAPESGKTLDRAFVAYMKPPKTYTGEDVVEISCHGGVAVLNSVLRSAISCGARLAQKGEFTKRAFLNGKIDLAQAEAVISLVKARTEEGALLAADQLFGSLSARIKAIRNKTLDLLSRIEASIDFPDDVEGVGEGVKKGTAEMIAEVDNLLKTADAGQVMRNGVPAAIIGKPNVGKSSLLNALLKQDRAIVSHTPGTTRDTVEETVSINGIPVLVMDTAGLRHAGDDLEVLGAERARRAIEKAGLLIVVLDASESLTGEDDAILNAARGKRAVVAMNKIDLGDRVGEDKINKALPGAPIFRISALKGSGIDQLEAGIFSTLTGGTQLTEVPVVTTMRQKQCLIKAREALSRAFESAQKGVQEDLISIDLRDAAASLGEVTGEMVSGEVIDRMFEEFCVGK